MLRSRVVPFCTPLSADVGNSQRSWSERRGLLLVIEDCGTGNSDSTRPLRGFGEASPLPGYSPDTIEECEWHLRNLEPAIIGALSVQGIEEFAAAFAGPPAARFAVETALLDLLAQQTEQSIASLLGSRTQHARRCALLDREAPLDSAQQCTARGITVAKLKVGRDWKAEFTAIKTLRQALPELALRLDANGAWSVAEARTHLEALAELDIEFVEQPVAPPLMPALSGSPVPLAADESLHSQEGKKSLAPLLASPSLRALVLKPTVLGGFFACLRLQRWANKNNTESLASHCFEGPVGSAAVAELAVATGSSLAAGVDEHEVLRSGPGPSIPQFCGQDIHSHSPGLGVSPEVPCP